MDQLALGWEVLATISESTSEDLPGVSRRAMMEVKVAEAVRAWLELLARSGVNEIIHFTSSVLE